jgi:hypothetical protein
LVVKKLFSIAAADIVEVVVEPEELVVVLVHLRGHFFLYGPLGGLFDNFKIESTFLSRSFCFVVLLD